VKIAAWDLACGLPEEGLSLLSRQIEAHPKMLISFSVLSHYYFGEGDFEKARRAETGNRPRLGLFRFQISGAVRVRTPRPKRVKVS
jgi:hypothetical protein